MHLYMLLQQWSALFNNLFMNLFVNTIFWKIRIEIFPYFIYEYSMYACYLLWKGSNPYKINLGKILVLLLMKDADVYMMTWISLRMLVAACQYYGTLVPHAKSTYSEV